MLNLDKDVQCYSVLITLVHPQVCLRGPYSRQAVILTGEQGEVSQHMHEMVYRRGQFSCKESSVARFTGLQYFLSEDQTPVVWVPPHMLNRPGFVISEAAPNLFRAVHPCTAVHTSISFFHDGEAVRFMLLLVVVFLGWGVWFSVY